MPESPLVRRLGAADVVEYRAIRLATLDYEPAFFGSLLADEIKRPIGHFARVIETDTVFGACVGPAVVGVVRLHAQSGPKERHKGGVHGFFVMPNHRRRGLGLALMSALIETARASLEQLTLNVVADNTQAIGLYEQIGFERYGMEPRARKYDGSYTDLVLMAMRLTA